jgi:glycosyltransferase involved in cell wall biosynthesis
MKDMELVFWEPLVSPHKLGLFEALVLSGKVGKLLQVSQNPLSEERKELGWQTTIPDSVPTIVAPSDAQVLDAIRNSSPDAIHVFSGIHWVPAIVRGIALAIEHKRHFGIMSEPRGFEGAKGIARLAHSWATEGKVRRHCDFVLAIGRHGPPWFRMAGYRADRIFPFAYFVGERQSGGRRSASSRVRIGFLGRLIHAKGFHLAVEAIRMLGSDVEFEIAGSGEMEELARGLANERPGSIRFHGALSMADVRDFLGGLDILLVPSLTRDDGWGVVLSEALEAGTAVVASGDLGASACISDARFGRRVERPNAERLVKAIQDVIASGTLSEGSRQFRANWAAKHLTASAGAAYMLEIFTHIYQGAAAPEPLFHSA